MESLVHARSCMLARCAGFENACSERCPFWESGGAVLDAGCALERILPEPDWTPELAQHWLRIRDRLYSGDDWQPTNYFSVLLR